MYLYRCTLKTENNVVGTTKSRTVLYVSPTKDSSLVEELLNNRITRIDESKGIVILSRELKVEDNLGPVQLQEGFIGFNPLERYC